MVRQDRAASSQQLPDQQKQKQAGMILCSLSVSGRNVACVAGHNKEGNVRAGGGLKWVPDGLTQLPLADVSGSSGSLHEHGVLANFLQGRDRREDTQDTPRPFNVLSRKTESAR